jgi:hypothetical protein
MQISESKRHRILELIKDDFFISEIVISKINNETSQWHYRGNEITVKDVEDFCIWWFYEKKPEFPIEIDDNKIVCNEVCFLFFSIFFFLCAFGKHFL